MSGKLKQSGNQSGALRARASLPGDKRVAEAEIFGDDVTQTAVKRGLDPRW